ncbi:MAG: PQQ-dependent sugar dehydrogenase [Rhodopirellula sp.]|nr:PQQ-dependent sugar dehydrogenase [Rhodopirellula sp.]
MSRTLGFLTAGNLRRLLALAVLLLPSLVPAQDEQPYGIDHYVPLTTSRVAGSPEPPLPYRAVRTMPKLQIDWPIFVTTEPGSDRLIFIDDHRPEKRFRVCRTSVARAASGEFDVLFELDDPAYSICFHPHFAQNGFFYLGHNGPNKALPKDAEKTCRVTRYTLQRTAPFSLVEDSSTVILEWITNGHNGAAVTFGLDGMLYVTTGDGTSDSDTNLTGQGLDHLLAKVLRLDVDHPDPGREYSVPADNPFVGQSGIRPETWAYGLRNPWRMTTDPKTGHIWVGQNGQDLWEQVYLIHKGDNYGWSVYEGSHPFYLERKAGPHPHVKPTFEHSHAESRSLTGGVVYYGSKFPELQGAYIYGDYSTGKIWAGKHDGKKVVWHREIADTTMQITSFGLDPHGELLITNHIGKDDGGFYTLEPIEPDSSPRNFPRKLSDSGLFADVAKHQMQPGAIPYSVNSPLWSDGAHKSRFFAIPHDAGKDGKTPKITPSGNRGWVFPNGTVLVKSFAVDMTEGDPASRRWIETRFLYREQNEWVGYSYRWNDEQTDATLVDKAGLDHVIPVSDATGAKAERQWRFPSRTECMVCHSRAANYVLGLSTPQMNRDHDYSNIGGVVDNQLRTLEHLGFFKLKRKPGKDVPFDEADHPRLANPYDASEPITDRALSYLHANCAQCHVEAGGGNSQMVLSFGTASEKQNIINADPLHDRFGIANAKLVAPGAPDRSILLQRIARRGRGQMPQLATALIDESAVALFKEWIRSLPEETAK